MVNIYNVKWQVKKTDTQTGCPGNVMRRRFALYKLDLWTLPQQTHFSQQVYLVWFQFWLSRPKPAIHTFWKITKPRLSLPNLLEAYSVSSHRICITSRWKNSAIKCFWGHLPWIGKWSPLGLIPRETTLLSGKFAVLWGQKLRPQMKLLHSLLGGGAERLRSKHNKAKFGGGGSVWIAEVKAKTVHFKFCLMCLTNLTSVLFCGIRSTEFHLLCSFVRHRKSQS